MLNFVENLRHRAIAEYELDLSGIHSINHWNDVYLNGIILSKQDGVDPMVVTAFAYMHDCKRINDMIDPDHGKRASAFIDTLDPSDLGLNANQVILLKTACDGHTDGNISDDPTIGACWDADRLDLVRCRMIPIPDLMSTEVGKILAIKMQKYKNV